jgi:hypothetical protein
MSQKLSPLEAESVISSLRSGTVPNRFVSSYSASDDFATRVSSRHFRGEYEQGKIRFVSGNWGSGKTHFLMRLREEAFQAGFLVASVEIKADETPFNKFEKVFYGIVRNITSAKMYENNNLNESIPFGRVLQEFLTEQISGSVDKASFGQLENRLMAETSIDIDFKKVIIQYWDTFVDDDAQSLDHESRARLLQWFEGVGTPALFRKDFRIQKTVNKENARLMLQSLANFIRWMGYPGLVILFDEAEMTNEIHDSPGIILVYATVPSFFTDPTHGIQIYGALAQRIGELPSSAPVPLQRVWNIDKIDTINDEQLEACLKILSLYKIAYIEELSQLPSDEELRTKITSLLALRPKFSALSSWRLAITGTVQLLDNSLEGVETPDVEIQYEGILKSLQDADS